MNALEKVVDLLVAVCVLFLIPLLYYGSGRRISQAMLVGQEGEHFLNTISTSGEITLPVWLQFQDTIKQFGCDTFEMRRERYVFEPGQEEGSVERRIYTVEKDMLLKQLLEEGSSRLRKGDRVTLTLYVNEIPMVYSERIRTGGDK